MDGGLLEPRIWQTTDGCRDLHLTNDRPGWYGSRRVGRKTRFRCYVWAKRHVSYLQTGTLLWGQSSPLCCSNYIIRKYVLPIWSEHNHIFSHRIVHSVYNYVFRPCILAIVRLYCKPNKQLYNMWVGYSGGNEISSYSSGWHAMSCYPLLLRRDTQLYT